MAAYGRGDYSGGAYSFGAYLGALAIASASTVTVAGEKIKDGSFAVVSASSVSIGSVKIANSPVVIDSTSAMTVAGGIDAVGNVDIVAVSILDIQYNRKRPFEMIMVDTSSVVINARKKWETEADVSETWTPIEDVSESWTTVSV
jgi:poly-gamma-glutamate capsule biosynthesis protein CapA/YwtB (metallophosphatase superfamily)